LRGLLKSLELINYDEKAAKISGATLAELKSKGQIINVRDLFISAIAIKLEDKIATRDVKHFKRIKNLEVETW